MSMQQFAQLVAELTHMLSVDWTILYEQVIFSVYMHAHAQELSLSLARLFPCELHNLHCMVFRSPTFSFPMYTGPPLYIYGHVPWPSLASITSRLHNRFNCTCTLLVSL